MYRVQKTYMTWQVTSESRAIFRLRDERDNVLVPVAHLDGASTTFDSDDDTARLVVELYNKDGIDPRFKDMLRRVGQELCEGPNPFDPTARWLLSVVKTEVFPTKCILHITFAPKQRRHDVCDVAHLCFWQVLRALLSYPDKAPARMPVPKILQETYRGSQLGVMPLGEYIALKYDGFGV